IMASKNNVIEEIQELIQKIKNEYEEEVDFHFLTWDEIHEAGVGIVKILSPRLRQYFRERFNFPTGVDDWLDYYKESKNGAYFYRTSKGGKYEYFWWHEVQKVHDERNTDKNPKKCSVCKQTTFKKDGRMKL
ncbi:36747_t:CDS:1, partial [Racocetra persica]